MSDPRVTVKLWLHREERDAWLCSSAGVGSGTYLPKSEISIEPGHPVPTLVPVGPVAVEMPEWLAEDRGLTRPKNEAQRGLFDP